MPYESLLRGRVSIVGQYYVVTTATANRYPRFESLVAGRVIINTLRALDAAGYTQTLAFVVMPDHVHWLMRLAGSLSLAEVTQRFKGRSARVLNADAQLRHRVWQKGFHDHAVRSDRSLEALARYIIENPIRAGIASHIGGYSLWDCAWQLPWELSGQGRTHELNWAAHDPHAEGPGEDQARSTEVEPTVMQARSTEVEATVTAESVRLKSNPR